MEIYRLGPMAVQCGLAQSGQNKHARPPWGIRCSTSDSVVPVTTVWNHLGKPNTLYEGFMSYRYYRLIDDHEQLKQNSLTPAHRYLKQLKSVMYIQNFSGNDHILVFYFLKRMAEGTDKLLTSEDKRICYFHNSSLTKQRLSSEKSKLAPVTVESLLGLKQSSISWKHMLSGALSVSLALLFWLCNNCPPIVKVNDLHALTRLCTDVLAFMKNWENDLIYHCLSSLGTFNCCTSPWKSTA